MKWVNDLSKYENQQRSHIEVMDISKIMMPLDQAVASCMLGCMRVKLLGEYHIALQRRIIKLPEVAERNLLEFRCRLRGCIGVWRRPAHRSL